MISCYFVGYSERSRGYNFYDPTTRSIFEKGNARFFKDVEFARGERTKDFVFEEEYIDISQCVIYNDQDQDTISDIVQDTITDQDIVIEPPIQVVLEEQTQQP